MNSFLVISTFISAAQAGMSLRGLQSAPANDYYIPCNGDTTDTTCWYKEAELLCRCQKQAYVDAGQCDNYGGAVVTFPDNTGLDDVSSNFEDDGSIKLGTLDFNQQSSNYTDVVWVVAQPDAKKYHNTVLIRKLFERNPSISTIADFNDAMTSHYSASLGMAYDDPSACSEFDSQETCEAEGNACSWWQAVESGQGASQDSCKAWRKMYSTQFMTPVAKDESDPDSTGNPFRPCWSKPNLGSKTNKYEHCEFNSTTDAGYKYAKDWYPRAWGEAGKDVPADGFPWSGKGWTFNWEYWMEVAAEHGANSPQALSAAIGYEEIIIAANTYVEWADPRPDFDGSLSSTDAGLFPFENSCFFCDKYEAYPHSNAYDGHGGTSLDSDEEALARGPLRLDQCQQLCDDDKDCECIAYLVKEATWEPAEPTPIGTCWKRTKCDSSNFDQEFQEVNTYVKKDTTKQWRALPGFNAWTGHGGVEITPEGAAEVKSLTECQSDCESNDTCECIVFLNHNASEGYEAGQCYLRASCVPSQMDGSSDMFDTYMLETSVCGKEWDYFVTNNPCPSP